MDRERGVFNDGDSINETTAMNNIANKIVDEILEVYQVRHKQSDSEVNSEGDLSSPSRSVDRRLQYWKDMLFQRRSLQQRLSQATGKSPNSILFSVDYDEVEAKETRIKKLKKYFDRLGLLGENEAVQSLLESKPHLNKLEVIGWNRWTGTSFGRHSLHSISSITADQRNTQDLKRASITKTRGTMTMRLSVLINGTSYCRYRPEYSPILERMFVCNPYERSLRTIMRIENDGQRLLTFDWERSDFFAYNNTLFNTQEEVFVFDTSTFQLRAGEVREVLVLFRPTKVGITKQRWLLTTKPRIFFRCPMALTLNMHGKCKPPQEYLEQLECQVEMPTRKCRKLSAIEITHHLNVYPAECPFTRELEDYEAFNRRNVGFHCKGYGDMAEMLNFFELVKPETGPMHWDYSVSMLIDLVCTKQDKVQRIELFARLVILLNKLRGRTTSLVISDSPTKLIERKRTRLIFVRGIIANNIDLWEANVLKKENRTLKLQDSKGKLKYPKYFLDSLYVYTYNLLCNVIEDIVSVIESTECA